MPVYGADVSVITPPDATHGAGPAAVRAFDVGIAGAGQLARMTCLAAWPLGIRVAVLGTPGEPAAPMAAGLVEGDWRDAGAVRALGARVGVVTLENEFVDAAALASVQAAGTPVRPDPSSLGQVQDKALQKELLRGAGLPTAAFLVVEKPRELAAAGRDLGWPLMLKARRLGYDGYGNATCADEDEARAAMARLDAGEGVLVEAMVGFEKELAAMVARAPQRGRGLLPGGRDRAARPRLPRGRARPPRSRPTPGRAPARCRWPPRARPDGVGVIGVEMFLSPAGEVLVNELAPRPHNSGHYTIEACETSQFENHLRGVLDMPLGDVRMRSPAAAMVNLLGSSAGPARPDTAAGAGGGGRPPASLRQGRGAAGTQDGPRHGARGRPGDGARDRPTRRGGGGAVSPTRAQPLVGIVMGSDSDLPVMKGAADVLRGARRARTRCASSRPTARRTT